MSVNDWLAVIVLVSSLYARSPAALCFCALYIAHMAVESKLVDEAYYLSLILIDSAVAIVTTAVSRPSRATIITGIASGLFMVANVAGLAAWSLYLSPGPYDAFCSVVYVAMAVALINEGINGRRIGRIHYMGGSRAGAAVREGVGLHNQGGDPV